MRGFVFKGVSVLVGGGEGVSVFVLGGEEEGSGGVAVEAECPLMRRQTGTERTEGVSERVAVGVEGVVEGSFSAGVVVVENFTSVVVVGDDAGEFGAGVAGVGEFVLVGSLTEDSESEETGSEGSPLEGSG